jgi:hypothetical protein
VQSRKSSYTQAEAFEAGAAYCLTKPCPHLRGVVVPQNTVVRNSWVTKDREDAGFWDAAAWESAKKNTDAEIEKYRHAGNRHLRDRRAHQMLTRASRSSHRH